MSQAELARRVRMTQPAMNQLFTGTTRSTTKIAAIARELNTTPEYLEGLTDDPTESFAGSYISDRERGWLDILREIAPTEREALLTLARALVGARPQPTLHSSQQEYRPG